MLILKFPSDTFLLQVIDVWFVLFLFKVPRKPILILDLVES